VNTKDLTRLGVPQGAPVKLGMCGRRREHRIKWAV